MSYLDGPAKSGGGYASKYAEENLISATCVLPLEGFTERAKEAERRQPAAGIVFLDDIAATGESIAANLSGFMAANRAFVEERSLSVVVGVLYATVEADARIRREMSEIGYHKMDLRVCEYLDDSFYVAKGAGCWSDENERNQALQLFESIGRKIYKNSPLGYGGLGLNIVFFDTCPNNSLPLLHSAGGGWTPLFPRSVN